MFKIHEVSGEKSKAEICNNILRALPEWFGVEESIVDYCKKVKLMLFYAAYENDEPVGFLAVKVHNNFSAEVYVMGVLKENHRQGIGKALIKKCEEYCYECRIEFLTVKTLDASRKDEGYSNTRVFYLTMGFRPLEVFPLYWDKHNPCLFMAKYLPPAPSEKDLARQMVQDE